MAVTLKGNNGTYEGTSEDNKPLDVPVNTEFNELDTGKTYYFDGETWNEEPPCEGSGFTPTAEQLAAMNSGINAEDVEQIATNENNISTVYDDDGNINYLQFDDVNYDSNIINGLKFTVNADKSITVNGKPNGTTAGYTYLFWKNKMKFVDDLCNGEYVLSGCPEGGSETTFKMYVSRASYYKNDYGNGVELPATSEKNILVVIYIHNSYTADNLTFKPMITRKNTWDISHKYYPKTNQSGQVCECYGDSLTWYDGNNFTWGAKQGYPCVGFESYLRDYFNMTVHNNGASGKTTPQICTQVKSGTFTYADYLLIMGGDNDDRLDVAVGSLQPYGSTHDTSTVIGALQDAIETVLTNTPRLRIILMTEPMGWTYRDGAMTRVDDKFANAYRTVAEYYGLPLIDNWKYSGINEATRAAYMADPISGNTNYIYHPSNEGWRRISMYMINELKKYVQ